MDDGGGGCSGGGGGGARGAGGGAGKVDGGKVDRGQFDGGKDGGWLEEECVICLEGKRTHLVTPCGHVRPDARKPRP